MTSHVLILAAMLWFRRRCYSSHHKVRVTKLIPNNKLRSIISQGFITNLKPQIRYLPSSPLSGIHLICTFMVCSQFHLVTISEIIDEVLKEQNYFNFKTINQFYQWLISTFWVFRYLLVALMPFPGFLGTW